MKSTRFFLGLQKDLTDSRKGTILGAVTAAPDATVEINFQRLDGDTSGNLVLMAQASVSFKGRPAPALRSFRATPFPVPGSGIG